MNGTKKANVRFASNFIRKKEHNQVILYTLNADNSAKFMSAKIIILW